MRDQDVGRLLRPPGSPLPRPSRRLMRPLHFHLHPCYRGVHNLQEGKKVQLQEDQTVMPLMLSMSQVRCLLVCPSGAAA